MTTYIGICGHSSREIGGNRFKYVPTFAAIIFRIQSIATDAYLVSQFEMYSEKFESV